MRHGDGFDGLELWFYNAAVYEVMSIKEWNAEHCKTLDAKKLQNTVTKEYI